MVGTRFITVSRCAVFMTIATLSVACGNRASMGSIDAAFRAKANAVCEAALARHEGQPPFPLEDFDRMRPNAEDLPPLGVYFGKYNDTHITAEGLAKLGEPETGREDWRTLLDLARQFGVTSRAQIDAANAKDAAAFVQAMKEGDIVHKRLGEAGPAAGFPESTACGKYYG